MKTIEFLLPSFFVSYFINSDPSGLTENEIKLADSFVKNNAENNKCFYCVDADIDNSDFSYYNEMPGMRTIGANVCKFTFCIDFNN